jgi:rhamnulokinase
MTVVIAVDLGASSGRVIAAEVDGSRLRMGASGRFGNHPVAVRVGDDETLRWDVEALQRGVLANLATACAAHADASSIGITGWGLDYALLKNGELRQAPYHHRDSRILRGAAAVHERVGKYELFQRNGLQNQPFNTLYQLTADRLTGALDQADCVLMLPDLFSFWLTGAVIAERTNASTTGLLGVRTGEWDVELMARLSLDPSLFPDLVDPGTTIGPLLGNLGRNLGARAGLLVRTVASHDTASAVLAVPASTERFAYISCGTWGLVGLEVDAPVLNEVARGYNFTNERGVDGRYRFLRNVMGLWIINEAMRTWRSTPGSAGLPDLLARATSVSTPVAVFDVNDPRFFPPGDMAVLIAEYCRERGLPVPRSRAELVRSIVESLAAAFVDAVRQACAAAGREVDVIHIVGGGAQNTLLCQRIADRAQLPVIAGPVEATAVGNALIQARALGAASTASEGLRALVRGSFELRRYDPSGASA